MVAPIRPSYVTLPEFEVAARPSNTPQEFAARESIVDEADLADARRVRFLPARKQRAAHFTAADEEK